jgi:hypothetical protein
VCVDLGGGARIEVLEQVGQVVGSRRTGVDFGGEGFEKSKRDQPTACSAPGCLHTSPSGSGFQWAAPRRRLAVAAPAPSGRHAVCS